MLHLASHAHVTLTACLLLEQNYEQSHLSDHLDLGLDLGPVSLKLVNTPSLVDPSSYLWAESCA